MMNLYLGEGILFSSVMIVSKQIDEWNERFRKSEAESFKKRLENFGTLAASAQANYKNQKWKTFCIGEVGDSDYKIGTVLGDIDPMDDTRHNYRIQVVAQSYFDVGTYGRRFHTTPTLTELLRNGYIRMADELTEYMTEKYNSGRRFEDI